MSAVHNHIDIPAPGDICDPLCFRVEGWVNAGAVQGNIAAVEVWVGDQCAGTTGLFFERPDVTATFGLPAGTRTGFRLVGHLSAPASASQMDLRVRWHSSTPPETAGTANVRFAPRDYRLGNFGILLRQETVGLMRPEHIYTTGPSLPEGSPDVLALLRSYLPPPPCRVLDVGCGLGYYGRQLRPLGYDWLGAEIKPADCAELARLNLPFRQVDGRTLPFADGAFDAAMGIEVLEHLEEPRAFLAEVRRVAPRRLLVSVPNAELIPYLNPYLVTPRHLLDSDHQNFFTRWSLRSLLREFYPQAEVLLHTRHPLAAVDGFPLFYNLFAVAWTP